MKKALDLFAGAGGWDVAAAPLGWSVDRVENWAPANATAEAASFGKPIHEDVRTFSASRGAYDLILASPSCKKFSPAGDGTGRTQRDLIIERVHSMGRELRAGYGIGIDPDAALTLEPLRITLECEPRAIALEQAPAVLPIWEAYANVLRNRGYSVVTSIINAEQYGVPQTRRRAVLLARRDRTAMLPEITHSRYWSRDPGRIDAEVKPWTSMRDVINLPEGAELVSNYGTGGDPRNRGVRTSEQPAATVTGKADRTKIVLRNGNQAHACVRPIDTPSGTMFFGARANWMAWEGEGWMRKITAEEAATLQTFPDGYPFQGGKSEIMQQIGNAVPPRLADALLKVLR